MFFRYKLTYSYKNYINDIEKSKNENWAQLRIALRWVNINHTRQTSVTEWRN